jgi:hypothetical protein
MAELEIIDGDGRRRRGRSGERAVFPLQSTHAATRELMDAMRAPAVVVDAHGFPPASVVAFASPTASIVTLPLNATCSAKLTCTMPHLSITIQRRIGWLQPTKKSPTAKSG